MAVALVTGAGGLLGRTVARALVDDGHEVHALAHEHLDVGDLAAVQSAFATIRPEFVVHCAALTDVDRCEREPDLAWRVNAEGPGYVASSASEVGAEVVAISTDYVFDGEKGSYVETDDTNPIQGYGHAKLAGEERVREGNPRHYVVRSAWIYGVGGKNFVSRAPDLAAKGESIKAIADQRSSPTFAEDLAHAIASLRNSDRYGTYHVINEGSCSYAEFFRHAFEVAGAGAVEDISHFDVPRPAPRPSDTSLVGEVWRSAGFTPLRPWRDAARAFMQSLTGA